MRFADHSRLGRLAAPLPAPAADLSFIADEQAFAVAYTAEHGSGERPYHMSLSAMSVRARSKFMSESAIGPKARPMRRSRPAHRPPS